MLKFVIELFELVKIILGKAMAILIPKIRGYLYIIY